MWFKRGVVQGVSFWCLWCGKMVGMSGVGDVLFGVVNIESSVCVCLCVCVCVCVV